MPLLVVNKTHVHKFSPWDKPSKLQGQLLINFSAARQCNKSRTPNLVGDLFPLKNKFHSEIYEKCILARVSVWQC